MAHETEVLWQPEAHAPFEPYCSCDGTDAAAEAIVAEVLEGAPAGAAARVEKGSGTWLLILEDPPEN